MKSVYRFVMLMAAAAMLFAAFAPCASSAQLASMAYGFPSIFENSQSTAFTRDIAAAQDLESASVNFGGCGGIGFLGGFPSISETSDKSYYAEHTDYSHNEYTAAFNYPFVGVGGAALPF